MPWLALAFSRMPGGGAEAEAEAGVWIDSSDGIQASVVTASVVTACVVNACAAG
jgi:hypothetical protein